MQDRSDTTELENRIRDEFDAAFAALEQASAEEKLGAAYRLNRAVRRVYDFVGYGKLPSD